MRKQVFKYKIWPSTYIYTSALNQAIPSWYEKADKLYVLYPLVIHQACEGNIRKEAAIYIFFQPNKK